MSASSDAAHEQPLMRALAHPLPPSGLLLGGDGDLDLETVTDAIAAGRPLAEILDLIAERAWLLLGADETYLLLREGDRLVGVAQRGLAVAQPAEITIKLGEGIEGWVAARRRPLIMTAPQADPRFRDLPQRRQPVATAIAIPLQVERHVLGVLAATSAEPRDFGADLMLLLVLADLATLAITDSRSMARQGWRTRLVGLLRFVSDANYEGDLPGALAPIANRIAEVMGAEKVDLMFQDGPRDALVSLGVSDTPLGHKQKELGIDILPLQAASLEADVMRSGKSALVVDAREDPRVYRPLVDQLGLRSQLLSPIAVGEERRGVLTCTSSEPGAFNDEDLAVLDLIARRLSLGLQQIALTDDLRRLESDRLDRIERDDYLELLLHDLKNPLATLKGYAQLAERRIQAGNPAFAAHALSMVSEKVDQVNQLIGDMLEVTRLAAGTFRLQIQEFDLAALLRDEADGAQTTTAAHTLTFAGPAAYRLWGDPARLAEVVQNLLGNAIQYAPGGGAITVTLAEQADLAEIAVCDQGMGIAPDDLPHVFERAYRGRGEQVSSGHGLGLYISREIVRLHGGRIWAEAQLQGGTCFRIALPPQRPE